MNKLILSAILLTPVLASASTFQYRVPADGVRLAVTASPAPSEPAAPPPPPPPPAPVAPTLVGDGVSKVGGCASGEVGCATLNLSDKSTYMALSNGNLGFASTNTSTWRAVRATISKSSGKWYWETTGAGISSGVGKSTANLDNIIGGDSSGWGYRASGEYRHAGVTAVKASADTTQGFALDMGAKTLTVYDSKGVVYTITGLTGPVYPMQATGNTNTYTVNFGQSNFQYAVPAGFNAGVW